MAKKIPWDYCECGCKCNFVQVGGLYFSIYNDLKGTYYYCKGSHNARIYGTLSFKSAEEVNQKIREALRERKKEIAKEQTELDELGV